MQVPKVTKGELFPAHAEEWIDLFVGLFAGSYPLLDQYANPSCQSAIFTTAHQLFNLHTNFDKAPPTTIINWILMLIAPLYAVGVLYMTAAKCIFDAQFNKSLEDWST